MKKKTIAPFWQPVKVKPLFNFGPKKKNNMPFKLKPKKSLTYPQAVRRYPRLNPFGDADRDGKLNMFDCRPFDKKRHTTVSFKNKNIKIETPVEVKPLVNVLNKKGRAYVVGGFVRDALLERAPKDVDIEVHGMTPEAISNELKSEGYRVDEVGKSFGVLKVSKGSRKEATDVSVPRADSTGRKPTVEFLESATPEKAASRRDFTINAIMYDTKDDKVVDPYKGVEDLEKGRIKAVTERAFSEDPLRVVRAAQFASRFGFDIDPETAKKAREAKMEELSGERIQEELRKVSSKSVKPSQFFKAMDEMGQLEKVFPEISKLKGVPQDKVHHPEGDAYVHTMQVIDKVAKDNDHRMFLAATLHDLGKVKATKVDTETGKISALEHEKESVELAKKFMKRFHYPVKDQRDVLNVIEHHMEPHNLVIAGATKLKHKNRLLAKAAGGYGKLASNPQEALERYKRIIEFAKKDTSGDEKLLEKYKELEELPPLEHYTPKVKGGDIAAQGYKGKDISKRMEELYKNQIAHRATTISAKDI